MKRNMKVKNNVDDMIYQVLNYIDHSNLPDDEADVLVYEILSAIIVWNCNWNPENIDIASVITQINEMLVKLAFIIPSTLEDDVKKFGYRETGE